MKPTPPEAIIFDLDDTLIDWWGSIDRCLTSFASPEFTASLQNYCIEACWHRHEEHGYVVQRDTWKLHEFRHDHWPLALRHIDESARIALMQKFSELLWVGFFDDVESTLDALVSTQRVALLSNNPHLDKEVRRLELSRWFTHTMSAAHTTPKPHVGAFHDACKMLDVDPSRTWYVGDSIRADAHGALAAGLTPIWVDRWNDQWINRPREVVRISQLSDLLTLID